MQRTMRARHCPGIHRTHRWCSGHCSPRCRLTTTHAGSTITQQLDDMLLTAVNLHHDRHGDYLQAVMLSNCTNSELAGQHDSPAMKLWPGGMVLYEVCRTMDFKGTPERQNGADGILRRHVVVDELSVGALEGALTRAGFQAQKLSVWMLQVERAGPVEELNNIAAEVSECAAQGSLLLGQAAGWSNDDVRQALASSGFMGSVTDWHTDAGEDDVVERCTFATQQHQFSLAQTGMYNRHVAAANDTDEDFIGNFS